MTDVWLLAALWLGLALTAALVSIHLRIATALSEIAVGVVAQLAIGPTTARPSSRPVSSPTWGRWWRSFHRS